MSRIIEWFFPNMSEVEKRKFLLLGSMLFLVLGSYWLLRLIKDTVVFTIAFAPSLGWELTDAEAFQTTLKFASPWVIATIVLIYSHFVDKVKRYKILGTLWGIYAGLFVLLSLTFLFREIFPQSFNNKYLMATIGFSSYLTIESFGALAVVMFWSFTNSITGTDSAKKGFPLILTIAHLGGCFFSGVMYLTPYIGLWPVIFSCSVAIITAILILNKFVKIIPKEKLNSIPKSKIENIHDEHKKSIFKRILLEIKDITAGGWLILKHPYLMGVLVISTFYEAVNQVVDFRRLSTAKHVLGPENVNDFSTYAATFGISVNLLTALISLVGIGFVLRRFGTRVALLIYPLSSLVILVSLFIYSQFDDKSYTMTIFLTVAMVLLKGFAYAVNNPCKEIMWIPTTKEIKFKSKGWIDSVAARLAKSGAAAFNRTTIGTGSTHFAYLFCFSIIFIWSLSAFAVGRKNKHLVEDKEIIG